MPPMKQGLNNFTKSITNAGTWISYFSGNVAYKKLGNAPP